MGVFKTTIEELLQLFGAGVFAGMVFTFIPCVFGSLVAFAFDVMMGRG